MASVNKLTDAAFRNIKPTDKEQLLADGGGLYVRIRSTSDGGAISFRLAYRVDGKQKWMTVGTYPTMSLKEARQGRDKHKSMLAEGIDPSLEKQLEAERKRHEQLAEKAAMEATGRRTSVKQLFNRWEQLALRDHKDKGAAVRRLFEKDVLPAIGGLAVEDVKKAHVIAIVDTQLARGVDRLAKMTLSLMRQMFRFAQDRDIIETDPTSTIRKAKIGKQDVERDRVLSEAEIRVLASKLPSARLTKTTECAVWIAIATGCRIGELLKAKWRDVDLDNGLWVIPPENSKNGEPLTIYLSAFAIQHFKALQSINHGTPWCYPDRKGKNHVCTKTIVKQLTDRQLAEGKEPMSNRSQHAHALNLSGGRWTPHDLRRTAGTVMTALGVLPDIADKCLNHKEQNRIRRTYLRHSYEAEKREAWRLLGERLELLTSDTSNVITASFQKTAA
jgi:integrase